MITLVEDYKLVILPECFFLIYFLENVLAKGDVVSTKPPAQFKAPQKRPDTTVRKVPTMQDYKRTMEAKAMSFGMKELHLSRM